MDITLDWLKEKGACSEGVAWFKAQKKSDAKAVLKALIAENQLEWANWTICRVFDRRQKIQYAVFAAEQVINLFEKKYPDDKRPRQAIEAAKKCIDDNSARASEAAGAAARAAEAAWAAAKAAGAVEAAEADEAAWAAGAVEAAEADEAARAVWAVRAAEADEAARAVRAAWAAVWAVRAAEADEAARAVWAAWAAVWAVRAAEKRKMKLKILEYGMRLL